MCGCGCRVELKTKKELNSEHFWLRYECLFVRVGFCCNVFWLLNSLFLCCISWNSFIFFHPVLRNSFSFWFSVHFDMLVFLVVLSIDRIVWISFTSLFPFFYMCLWCLYFISNVVHRFYSVIKFIYYVSVSWTIS